MKCSVIYYEEYYHVHEGNKEAKTSTACKIINVDHYQFSVERSMKQRAEVYRFEHASNCNIGTRTQI